MIKRRMKYALPKVDFNTYDPPGWWGRCSLVAEEALGRSGSLAAGLVSLTGKSAAKKYGSWGSSVSSPYGFVTGEGHPSFGRHFLTSCFSLVTNPSDTYLNKKAIYKHFNLCIYNCHFMSFAQTILLLRLLYFVWLTQIFASETQSLCWAKSLKIKIISSWKISKNLSSSCL